MPIDYNGNLITKVQYKESGDASFTQLNKVVYNGVIVFQDAPSPTTTSPGIIVTSRGTNSLFWNVINENGLAATLYTRLKGQLIWKSASDITPVPPDNYASFSQGGLLPNTEYFIEAYALTPGQNPSAITELSVKTRDNFYTVEWYDYVDGNLQLVETISVEGLVGVNYRDPNTRLGYTFSGWRLNAGPTILTAGDFPYVLTSNIQLTAIFTKNSYTIRWYNEEGTQILKNQIIDYGDKVYYTDAPTITKTGYTLTNFIVRTAAGGGFIINWTVDGSTKYVIVFQDLYIYPVFTINTYTITFSYWESGDITLVTKILEYNTLLSSHVPTVPNRPNYNFTGWNPEITSQTRVTQNQGYEAQYVLITYNVSWRNPNDTIIRTDSNITVNTLIYKFNAPTATPPEGYTVTDWSIFVGGVSTSWSGTSPNQYFVLTANAVLYPIYTPIKYFLRFRANGQVISGYPDKEYDYGTNITSAYYPPDPILGTCDSWSGWSTDKITFQLTSDTTVSYTTFLLSPSNLNITSPSPSGFGSFTFNWTATCADQYRYRLSDNGTNYGAWSNFSTIKTITGCGTGDNKYIEVEAKNSTGTISKSGSVPLFYGTIGAPSLVSGKTTLQGSFTGISCATSYTVQRSTSNLFTSSTYTPIGSNTSFNITVATGVTWYVRILATNEITTTTGAAASVFVASPIVYYTGRWFYGDGSYVSDTYQAGTYISSAPINPGNRDCQTFNNTWSPGLPYIINSDTNFIPQYTTNRNTVTWYNGYDNNIKSLTYDCGSTVLTTAWPSDPTRAGYTFDGWDMAKVNFVIKSNVTISATWKVSSVTIRWYNFEGGLEKSLSVSYGTVVQKASYPTLTVPNCRTWSETWSTAPGFTATADTNISPTNVGYSTPGLPGNVLAKDEVNKIKLTWTTATCAYSYRISWKRSNVTTWGDEVAQVGGTSYTTPNIPAGQYDIRIRSRNYVPFSDYVVRGVTVTGLITI